MSVAIVAMVNHTAITEDHKDVTSKECDVAYDEETKTVSNRIRDGVLSVR